MTLNSTTSTLLIVWFLVGSLLQTALLGGLVVVLMKLSRRLDALESKADPALRQTEALLAEASQKLAAIGGSAEAILHRGEAVTTLVQERTESTLGLVQKAVYAPFVQANALLAGLAFGARTFGALQARPHTATEPPSEQRGVS